MEICAEIFHQDLNRLARLCWWKMLYGAENPKKRKFFTIFMASAHKEFSSHLSDLVQLERKISLFSADKTLSFAIDVGEVVWGR